MSKIKFRDSGEEHNFWQNYTDLMSGLLIVFIIASLVAYNQYKQKEKLMSTLVEMAGGSKTGDLSDVDKERLEKLVSNAELYEKVRTFDKAQESLNSNYFHFDALYRRFECKLDVQFSSENSTISPDYNAPLVQAGKEFIEILKEFPSSDNVGFKVVIEGRAAKKIGLVPSLNQIQYADTLSYKRARNLYFLWNKNGIIDEIEKRGGEVFVSGSGYFGKGRHTKQTDPKSPDPEGLNKRFIIEVIPFIKF
jgi:hypothetical protein